MKLAHQVYIKLLEVPIGKITTYSELAKAVGLKNGQRHIGQIMKNNPYPIIIPCHRVVKSDGMLGGYEYGTERKANILFNEGIEIRNGKILDFEKKIYVF